MLKCATDAARVVEDGSGALMSMSCRDDATDADKRQEAERVGGAVLCIAAKRITNAAEAAEWALESRPQVGGRATAKRQERIGGREERLKCLAGLGG
jgi:hypothetical protein